MSVHQIPSRKSKTMNCSSAVTIISEGCHHLNIYNVARQASKRFSFSIAHVQEYKKFIKKYFLRQQDEE